MFKENTVHFQESFFNSTNLMAPGIKSKYAIKFNRSFVERPNLDRLLQLLCLHL
jgi:hypothetical protein